jgi:hypothetical protein
VFDSDHKESPTDHAVHSPSVVLTASWH